MFVSSVEQSGKEKDFIQLLPIYLGVSLGPQPQTESGWKVSRPVLMHQCVPRTQKQVEIKEPLGPK